MTTRTLYTTAHENLENSNINALCMVNVVTAPHDTPTSFFGAFAWEISGAPASAR